MSHLPFGKCYSKFRVRKTEFDPQSYLPGRAQCAPFLFGGYQVVEPVDKKHEPSPVPPKPPQPQGPVDQVSLRKEISDVVGREAISMVERVIEGLDIRHYLAMKYLFEVSGLFPKPNQDDTEEDDDSLARTLLSRLGLDQIPLTGSEVTKEPEMAVVAPADHAVK
jgi:hypothetical protein